MKRKNESTVFMAMLQSSRSLNMKWNLYVGLHGFAVMDLFEVKIVVGVQCYWFCWDIFMNDMRHTEDDSCIIHQNVEYIQQVRKPDSGTSLYYCEC
jgi:hypothetical protein